MTSEEHVWIENIVSGGPGSELAFTKLTQKYGPRLFTQIVRIIKNESIAKDVLQNVFIKIWKNLSRFKKESNLYTWMYRIAHNESLSMLTHENKRTGVSLDYTLIDVIPGHEQINTLGPDEIYQLLREAIETLPEKQALVFELKYFEDLKYSEIAKITDTSEGALKASFHIAKEKITKFLEMKLNY